MEQLVGLSVKALGSKYAAGSLTTTRSLAARVPAKDTSGTCVGAGASAGVLAAAAAKYAEFTLGV